MTCAWKEFLRLVPPRMCREVDRLGRVTMQELRLRLGQAPELVLGRETVRLADTVTPEDLRYCVNAGSQYSPWAAETVSQGYLTAAGGHRIGLCGDAVVREGQMTGIRSLRSVNLRVARDFPGIAARAAGISGSVMILGPPGSGKTTLLRDLIRCRAEKGCVAVVDERGELFPPGFAPGKRTDILTGCPKAAGIDAVLRTMGPDCVAVDEITAAADCAALHRAAFCGVTLLATAHAASAEDFYRRPVYGPLCKSGLFETLLVLSRDKSWTVERVAR